MKKILNNSGGSASRGWVNGALIVFSITFVYRILGFLRESVIASFLGNTSESDAYYISYAIPYLIVNVLAWGAMSAAVVPAMASRMNQDEYDGVSANTFISRIAVSFGVIFTGISVILYAFSKYVIAVLAPGFDSETSALAVSMIRKMIPMIILIGMSGLFSAVLNAYKDFKTMPFSNLVFNAGLVLGSFLAAIMSNINILAFSLPVSAALQLCYCYARLKRQNFRFSLSGKIFTRDERLLMLNMLPICLSTLLVMSNQVIGRAVASNLAAGSIASLNFAEKIYHLPLGIIVGSVLAATLPYLSDYAHRNDKKAMADVVKKSTGTLIVIICPIVFLMIFFNVPIVNILFERGAFTAEDTARTAGTLRYFAVALIGAMLIEINNRIFYSIKKPIYPLLTMFFVTLLNCIFAFLLSKLIGQDGVALALAISLGLGVVLGYIILYNKEKAVMAYFKATTIIKYTGVLLISGLSISGAGWLLPLFAESAFLIRFVIFCLFALILMIEYTVLLHLFKLIPVISLVKVKLQKRDKFIWKQ